MGPPADLERQPVFCSIHTENRGNVRRVNFCFYYSKPCSICKTRNPHPVHQGFSWVKDLSLLKRSFFDRRRTCCTLQQVLRLSKNLVEFRRRNGEIKSSTFSGATCACQKTLLSLQTRKLCAAGARFMRCSRLQSPMSEKACLFRQARRTCCTLQQVLSAGSGQDRSHRGTGRFRGRDGMLKKSVSLQGSAELRRKKQITQAIGRYRSVVRPQFHSHPPGLAPDHRRMGNFAGMLLAILFCLHYTKGASICKIKSSNQFHKIP